MDQPLLNQAERGKIDRLMALAGGLGTLSALLSMDDFNAAVVQHTPDADGQEKLKRWIKAASTATMKQIPTVLRVLFPGQKLDLKPNAKDEEASATTLRYLIDVSLCEAKDAETNELHRFVEIAVERARRRMQLMYNLLCSNFPLEVATIRTYLQGPAAQPGQSESMPFPL